MAEQKESSVLFSLKELMGLEEDRIRQEEADRQRVAQAEMQARMDAEKRARDDEESRIQAEENRRRAEESRQREEAARLEAIRHAEVERARLEAENKARLDAMRHQQEHERHLTAITQEKGKKQAVMLAVGVGVLLLFVLIGGGLGIKSMMDSRAIADAQHQKELAEQKAQVDKLTRELNDQNSAVASLEDAVKNAKDEGAKEQAQRALAQAQAQRDATRKRMTAVGGGGGAKPASGGGDRPKCNCAPGDPLCSCL